MAGSMNKVILIGNIGKDPELKMTPGGQALARFSLATTEAWKTPDGEKKEKTEWHRIVVWGKQAEIAEKYLRKGEQVMVEGRIQYGEYTDQAGVKKTTCDIRCDSFIMLGRMEEGGSSGSRGSSSSSRNGGFDDPLPPPPAGAAPFEDDIPF